MPNGSGERCVHRVARRRLMRWLMSGLMWLPTVAVATHAASAQASGAGGGAARTFELRPREGLVRQFGDGYRRHLDWHRRAGERWVWYLWQVVDGDRAGLLVDGTFGRTWGDFDAAVDPAGDAADNAVNVEPYVVRAANQAWRSRPDLGGRPVDLEAAPFGVRTEYRVRPGADASFVAALRRLRVASGVCAYAVYELVSGGDSPTYVLWVPARTWAAVADAAELAAVIGGGGRRDTRTHYALAEASQQVRRELWRFRPDLSICRAPAAGCHRTLEAGPGGR